MTSLKNEKEYGARVVLILTDKFAKAVNDNGLEYAHDDPALSPAEFYELRGLQEAMAGLKASLSNQMRDFEYYVESSDAHGAPGNAILDFTRFATKSDRAVERYATRFVVSMYAGRKMFDSKTAENIAFKLRLLEGQGAVSSVSVQSGNPESNPKIPEKFLEPYQ